MAGGGKVTPVRVGTNARNLGKFHCKTYSLFDDEERDQYAELRTKAQDPLSGIKIERIKEFTKTETEITGEGAEHTILRKEELYVLVEFWEKNPNDKAGKPIEELPKGRTWSVETSHDPRDGGTVTRSGGSGSGTDN